MPDGVNEEVAEFERLIVWKSIMGSDGKSKVEIPEPQPGIDDEFDEANTAVDAIKQELDEICSKI